MRKRNKEMFVSWEGFDEKDSTWEPNENLPTEMAEAFCNHRKKQMKQKHMTNSLNDLLLKEINRRAEFSIKSRMERGTFAKKGCRSFIFEELCEVFF